MSSARRLLSEPPRHVAALAAVVAAGLVALGALSALALLSSDFPLPLAERLQRTTTTLRTSVPLLLVAALALAGEDPALPPGSARRVVAPGALAVAAVAGALLVGRTVADVAAGRPGAAGARLDEVLVDLGALALTVAAGWWAGRSWGGLSAPG